MIEKFRYSSGGQVFRRKTLTGFQKFLLYLIVFIGIAASGLIAFFSEQLQSQGSLFIVLLLAPTLLTFVLVLIIALNPKGPERDIILPGSEEEVDPNDCSTVVGKVRLVSGELRDVEVIVPNVHGMSAISVLVNSSTETGSDMLAYEEMFEFAIETVRVKYANCEWEGQPDVKK